MNFYAKLDHKPKLWEDCTSLYCAYLVEQGIQSTTLKSYKSAIKQILCTEGYQWDDN